MKTVPTPIHMVDALSHVGCEVQLPTAGRQVSTFVLTSAELASDRIILGLNSVTVRLPLDQSVRLWTAQTKAAHTRCGASCNKEKNHAHAFTEASTLPLHVGAFVFLDGGVTPGPHRLLSASVDNDEVVVTFTAEEAIGPIDYKVTLYLPQEAPSTI
jgi:hypothetical protein